MSTLALEVDATLARLDPQTAARFERLVRDAVALVQPDVIPGALTPDYFDSVIGAFEGIEFDRPEQGPLPEARVVF